MLVYFYRKIYKRYVLLRNMEIVSRISRGSKMDQIYIPKNRSGLAIGSYVVVKDLVGAAGISKEKLHFYGLKKVSQIKVLVIEEILKIIEQKIPKCENLFVTGSFLEEGFSFNDIDVLIVSESKVKDDLVVKEVLEKIGLKVHLIVISNKELIQGLETDPLYLMMLSRCVSKNRFVYKTEKRINYNLLDLHLLKSKSLIDNFDLLTGKEKYDSTRNLFAICLFLDEKKITSDEVDNEIIRQFRIKSVREIKQNVLDKQSFLKSYKMVYMRTFDKILRGIENGTKQK